LNALDTRRRTDSTVDLLVANEGRVTVPCQDHSRRSGGRRPVFTERQLAKGDKAPVSNTGFRRYLKTISGEHFAIDPDKIEDDVLTCRFTTASGENSGWPRPITAEALCASQRGTHRPSNKNRLREMIAPGSTPE
jgi:hypothetical protein